MKTLIIICLGGGVLLMFWSCDTPSTSFQASIETIENISGAELEKKLSSLSAGKTGYTCSVSTWDMPGSEKQNTHVSVIHYFPDDLVEQADGKIQTWTFVVTGPSQGEPKSFGEYENVVQIARCSLPDVEGIEEIMTDRLLNINPATGSTKLAGADNQRSWHIHAYPEKSASIQDREPQDPDISNPMSGSCLNGVFCTLNFITIATVGEVVISITTRCIEWTYLAAYCGGGGGIPYYPPGDPGGPADPGGGGGSGPPGVPPGGDGSPVDDPCHIDTNDPNQPPQAQPVECLNDPCDWLAPPVGWMCGDTCQTNDAIIDNINVQVAINEAWQASYGSEINPLPHNQRDEKIIALLNDNGNYSSVIFDAQSVSSCHISANFNLSGSQAQNLMALIHIHPFTPGHKIEDQRCLDARNYPSGTRYGEEPSEDDYHALNAFNLQLINNNLNPAPMLVMDSENIYTLYQTQTIQDPNNLNFDLHFQLDTYNRCGY